MSVQIFNSEILNVSIASFISEDNEIYFKAKDVAEALGYEKPRNAIDRHVWIKNKFEWCNIKGGSPESGPHQELSGIQPHMLFFTEPGVYQLIFKSELPSAENFQDWVFSEILPSVRRTERYSSSSSGTPAIEGTVLEILESIPLENVLNHNEKERIKVNSIAKKIVEKSKDEEMSELGKKGGKQVQENVRETKINLKMAREEIEKLKEEIEKLKEEIEKLKEEIETMKTEMKEALEFKNAYGQFIEDLLGDWQD